VALSGSSGVCSASNASFNGVSVDFSACIPAWFLLFCIVWDVAIKVLSCDGPCTCSLALTGARLLLLVPHGMHAVPLRNVLVTMVIVSSNQTAIAVLYHAKV
jgi:hypothetical protein